MSSVKTILKNIGFLSIGEILGNIFSFILVIIIARYLGTTTFGKYSFAFAFVGIFFIISDIGIGRFFVREIARDKGKTEIYFRNYMTIKLVLSFLLLILPSITILFMNRGDDVILAVFLAALALTLESLTYPFQAVFKAYEQMEHITYGLIIQKFSIVLLGGFVLLSGYGLVPLIWMFVIAYALKLIYFERNLSKKIVKLGLSYDKKLIKIIVKNSLPFWFSVIFMTLYFRIDTVMITLMKDFASTGWYNAAHGMIDALSKIPLLVAAAVYPAMSRSFTLSTKILKSMYKKTFYYLFLLILPIGIGTTLLADKIILLIYGPEFFNSGIALQILIWTAVFIFVNYIMGYLLNSIDKQILFTITTGIGAFVNIILNLILIPIYGYVGAAISTVGVELLNFIFFYYFTTKYGYKLNLITVTWKPITAGIIMGIFIYFLRDLSIFYSIPLGAISYIALLFILKGIGKEELNLIKNFTSR